ncbi:NAD(P)-binding protein [Trematosphaeria pertusa]|uniref:NAD(P)-binding protein n=1 Tax=Trematosphaeria pertusa TaxID=390896 RepID=A0A6A6HT26_9PLEO|nr:NAD(P)-binding protein [Trematosphaeria pertusa]KAF2241167.1 NAD(P)-binding protein [Trematosphaeria pertusa]
MSPLILRRLRDKFWPEPLPPVKSFEGQTVLVTGATAGLGLAAALHFATLGASVVITSRSLPQGNGVKDEVEKRAGIVGQGKIHVIELDLSRYSSCLAFVDRLKEATATRRGLDVAVLNAGLINAEYVQSPEGWEETIQVNTLSTTLLGLLLLQLMRKRRPRASRKPHLVFVTSRDHIDPDIRDWARWATDDGILRHCSDRQNWPSHQIEPNYANSKLLLTYAVEEICKKAVEPDGRVGVIVNTVCPGLVFTSLGRAIAKGSTLMQLAVPLHASVLGKSADYGARFYVTAARTSEDEHWLKRNTKGKYIQSLFGEEEYRILAFPNLKSDTALKVKALVWNEIITEMKRAVPVLEQLEGA